MKILEIARLQLDIAEGHKLNPSLVAFLRSIDRTAVRSGTPIHSRQLVALALVTFQYIYPGTSLTVAE